MSSAGFPITNELPVPEDDGACKHLVGSDLAEISLNSTSGQLVDLRALQGLNILFTYPRTGAPGEDIPDDWNSIPGARGCSPQACSFRDSMTTLRDLGVGTIYGLSTQDTDYQQEAKERLRLSYELLSDKDLQFTKGLKMPTFEYQGQSLVKRTVMILDGSKIKHVFYPVFPSDASAALAIEWLEKHQPSEQL